MLSPQRLGLGGTSYHPLSAIRRSAHHNTKVKRRKELTLIMILIRCPLSSFSPSQMEDGSSNGRMECSYPYRIESLE